MFRAAEAGSRLCHTPDEVRQVRAVYAYATNLDNAERSRQGTFRNHFSVDHIKPIAQGGATVAENLQIVRRADDELKGSRTNVTIRSYEVPQDFIDEHFPG